MYYLWIGTEMLQHKIVINEIKKSGKKEDNNKHYRIHTAAT
jgi:hypothetical protein